MRCLLYPVLIILIVFFSCNNEKTTAPVVSEGAELNTSMIKITGLNGQPVNMDLYKGKTLFINFWATWCKPCLEEMPTIQKAKEILKNENIEFLFASDETTEQIESFKKAHAYDFNFGMAENLAELNVMALPTTFIFNAAGKLVFNEMGYRQWDDNSNIEIIKNIIKEK